MDISKFQPIGTHQEEIAKKFCLFQIREEGTKLNSATQKAIGFALLRLIDGDAVAKVNIKKAFATCREEFCSINGAPIGRLIDEGMRKERAMLAQSWPQTETKNKMPFGNRNGRLDKKLKKELTLAQREISNLKNQLQQAKENIAKECAERSSKSKKDDSPDEEVGSKRVCQLAKWAKASRPGTSPPSPPRKGFKRFRLITTVTRRRNKIIRNRMQEQHTPRQSLLAFNQSSMFQKKTSRMEIEPGPTRARAGQVMTRIPQRLINLAIDPLQDDEDSGQPDSETDEDDQESVNVIPQFEVQDDGIIEFTHNINIMTFLDEIIWTNKHSGQILPLRNIVCGPIEPTVTVPQLESWAVSDNGASEAFNMYEANDISTQHGLDPRVDTCRLMICLRRAGMFLDYKIAYSKDSECTESLEVFSPGPADALHVKYPLSPITMHATK